MLNLFKKEPKSDAYSFDTIDRQIQELAAKGRLVSDENPLTVDPDRVVFSRGEKFLKRLERYKNEVQYHVGKRKLTSKPRFLTGSGTSFNEIDQIMPTHLVKYHDLEDILSSNDVPDPETVFLEHTAIEKFFANLNASHNEVPSSAPSQKSNSSSLQLDSFYPSENTPDLGLSSLNGDNIAKPTTPTRRGSTAQGLKKPKAGRRRTQDDIERIRGDRLVPHINAHQRGSLHVVYLSPQQFRHDSSIQQAMRALGGGGRKKPGLNRKSLGALDNTNEWFEAEYEGDATEEDEVFIHELKVPPDGKKFSAIDEDDMDDDDDDDETRSRQTLGSRLPYMHRISLAQKQGLDDASQTHDPPLDLVYFSKGKQATFSAVNTFFHPVKGSTGSIESPDMDKMQQFSFPVDSPDLSVSVSGRESRAATPDRIEAQALSKNLEGTFKEPGSDSHEPSYLEVATSIRPSLPPPLPLPPVILKIEHLSPPPPPDSGEPEPVESSDDGDGDGEVTVRADFSHIHNEELS